MIEAQPIQTRVESFSKPSLDMPMGRDYIPPRYGPSVDEPQKTIEINRRQANAATSSQTGAFYGLIVDDAGDTYLQGGTCTGGNGTKTFSNTDLKVIDATTGPTGTEGHHLYLHTTGNGTPATNGILLPGWNQTACTDAKAASVPPNDLPSVAGTTSKECNISLGVFTATGFTPAASGDISVSFCPGSFSVTRSA